MPRDWSAGFALALMVKDVTTANDLARATGTPTPLGDAVARLWLEVERGQPDDADHTEVARWVEALGDR